MNAGRWLLMPLAWLYGGIISARNARYDHVSGAVHHADVPVISVGNITVGGTGKTPMVIEIVRRLRQMGRRPAILTRGYAAKAGASADEVLEFQDSVPDVAVVVNPDRVAGAELACRSHQADCLVLDDGFQHRRLARELDVVLIDALRPWGGGCLLPAGRLREPPGSLRRADLLVITRANQVEAQVVERITEELRRRVGEQPIALVGIAADAVTHLDGRRGSIDELKGRRVLSVCGLGNPRTFEKLVSTLGLSSCQAMVFSDHHRYSGADVSAICSAARRAKADAVVTTRKDWVKLRAQWPADDVDLLRLDTRLEWLAGAEHVDAELRRALESRR